MNGSLLIFLGIFFSVMFTLVQYNFAKQRKQQMTFLNYLLPFYKVKNHEEFAFRTIRQIPTLWIFIGVVYFFIERIGLLDSGIPLLMEPSVIIGITLVVLVPILRLGKRHFPS